MAHCASRTVVACGPLAGSAASGRRWSTTACRGHCTGDDEVDILRHLLEPLQTEQKVVDRVVGAVDVVEHRDEQIGQQLAHQLIASGGAPAGCVAELGVPQHVIPIGVRRDARDGTLAQLVEVVREADHLRSATATRVPDNVDE